MNISEQKYQLKMTANVAVCPLDFFKEATVSRHVPHICFYKVVICQVSCGQRAANGKVVMIKIQTRILGKRC